MSSRDRPRDHAADGAAGGDGAARPPDERDPRFAQLVADLAERLRPACAQWDEDAFETLVRRIARLKLRWGDAHRRGGG
jgi:hypothetical protein